MPNRNWSVGEIRLTMPLKALASRSDSIWTFDVKAVFDLGVEDINEADLIIIQRQASPFVKRLVCLLSKANIPYVFEIDDYLWGGMPGGLDSSRVWARRRDDLIEIMRDAACVTTTTFRLAARIETINQKVAIIPNALPDSTISENHADAQDLRPTLILAASDTMMLDGIMPALKRVVQEKDVQIVAIGAVSEQLSAASMEHVKYPILEYARFEETISRFPNAIGLIPCDSTEFSQCKSPIKFYSYVKAGIPVIASNTPPYSDAIVSHVNGVLSENSFAAWYEAMVNLLSNEADRKKYIASYGKMSIPSLQESASLWEGVFLELLGKSESGSRCRLEHLPSSFDWRFLGYLFSFKKYLSLFSLLRRNGISALFRLFRKGM